MLLELMYVNSSGVVQAPMPDAKGLELSPIFSDVGIVKFSYPKSGVNSQYIVDGNEFAVYMDGSEIPDSRFILEETGIDEADEAPEWDLQSTTMLGQFAFALVYPPAWPVLNPQTTDYTNAKPGLILKDLISKAQTRGCLSGFSTSTFTNTTDSNGAAWTKQVTISYDPGVSILSVIQNLVEQGAIEVKMVGKSLQVYNPGTLGTDLSATQPQMILRVGRDMKDSPRKTSRKELGTVILMQGESGYFQERTDSAAVTAYGRREIYASQSGITDSGTLAAYGDAVLGTRKQPRVEKTHGLVFAEQGVPKPFTNFNVGDWINSDTNGTIERYRIKQWTLKVEDDGSVSGSVVLNDLFADTVERLVKEIDGINGSAVTGTSAGTPTDTTIPSAPAAPAFSSSTFNDSYGTTWAQITVTWSAITTNTDGSPITDLDNYTVQYGFGATPTAWMNIYSGTDLTCQFSPLKPGTTIALRVGAYDKSGKFSGWSPLQTGVTGADSTPPPVPSTPVAVAYLGSIKAVWDGTFVAAAPKPADFRHVEVHIGLASSFTPDDSTQVGVLTGPGSVSVPALTYGQQYWVKFRSVDLSGNKSAASTADDATPATATVGDIEPSVLADVSSDPVFVQYFGNGDGVSGWTQYADMGDLVSLEDQSFEAGTIGNWVGSGSVPPTLANDTTHPGAGTKGLKVTWGTGGSFPSAVLGVWGFIAGRTYRVQSKVWVPSGSPDIQWVIQGGPLDTVGISTKNTLVQYDWTFTATGPTHSLALWPKSAPTAGQIAWIDDIHITDMTASNVSWYNDTLAPTVPGVLRARGETKMEWTGSSPFPYDPEAVYNFRGRFKISAREMCSDGNFALGTGANWDTFWGGTVNWVYSANTGKATSAAAGTQGAVLRNGGTNSNPAPAGTVVKISGKVRTSYASGAGPFVEMVTSSVYGQALYFGTGSMVGAQLVIDPSPDATTWVNFYLEATVPPGQVCYTVYFRDYFENVGEWVEWDDLSIKELSQNISIGMIGYKSDRITPIQPDNVTSGKAVIHAALSTNTGIAREGDWYEYDVYISDRSADAASGNGLSAKTALSMAEQVRYWRPAIILDTSGWQNDATIDVDWFQIDRIKSNIAIPGAILASAVDADTVIGDNLVATGTFRFADNPVANYVLTSVDDQGSAAWMRPAVPAAIGPVQPGGNLLDNDSSIFASGTVGDWAANANCTVSYNAGNIYTDPNGVVWRVLTLTATASADMSAYTSFAGRKQKYVARPGDIIKTSMMVYRQNAGNVRIDIGWYDSTGAQIGATNGVLTAVSALTWTQVTAPDATAPAGTAYCMMFVYFVGMVSAQIACLTQAKLINSTYTTQPENPRPGDLWFDKNRDFEEMIWRINPANAAETTPANATSVWTQAATLETFTIDIPCNGILLIDYSVFLRIGTAGTIIAFRIMPKSANGCTATSYDNNNTFFNQARLAGPTVMASDAKFSGQDEYQITGVEITTGASIEFSWQFYNSGAGNRFRLPSARLWFKPLHNDYMVKVNQTT